MKNEPKEKGLECKGDMGMKIKHILSILLFIVIETILYIFTMNDMAIQIAKLHLESIVATLSLGVCSGLV